MPQVRGMDAPGGGQGDERNRKEMEEQTHGGSSVILRQPLAA
jgi:hypothetical protein